MLFTELPRLERPAAAAATGFALVESWWPPAEDLEGWVHAVRAAGVGVSCLNADCGDVAAGERGFCNLPEHDGRTFAAVGAALKLARQVGCPVVNVLPGLLDDPADVSRHLAHAAHVYRACGDLAAASGRTIVIEPINALDVPAYLLAHPDEVASFLERVDHPNVRMLFDAYHCARAGTDPVEAIHRHADVIGHVQFADSPGRGAPGTGTLDVAAIADALTAVGYDGAIGLEFTPAGTTRDAVAGLPGLGLDQPAPGTRCGET